jgi:hypothetical protein
MPDDGQIPDNKKYWNIISSKPFKIKALLPHQTTQPNTKCFLSHMSCKYVLVISPEGNTSISNI